MLIVVAAVLAVGVGRSNGSAVAWAIWRQAPLSTGSVLAVLVLVLIIVVGGMILTSRTNSTSGAEHAINYDATGWLSVVLHAETAERRGQR